MPGYGLSFGAGGASDAIARILAQRETQKMNELQAQAQQLSQRYREREYEQRERQLTGQDEDRKADNARLAAESKARLEQETGERSREKLRLDEENAMLADPDVDPRVKLGIRLKRAGVTMPASMYEDPATEMGKFREQEEIRGQMRAKYRAPSTAADKKPTTEQALPSGFARALDAQLINPLKQQKKGSQEIYDIVIREVERNWPEQQRIHPNMSYSAVEAYVRKRIRSVSTGMSEVAATILSGAGRQQQDEEDEE
jgi:hypothetical protein